MGAIPAVAGGGERYGVISHLDDLTGLSADGWDELVASMPRPTPFLLHGWVAAWWRHYGAELDLAVHVVHRGGQLVAALPLAVGPVFPATRAARFVGAPDSTLADLIAGADQDPALLRSLLDAAVAAHGLLDLYTVAAESHVASMLGTHRLRTRTEAPVMRLRATWEETLAAKASRRRRSLYRRRWRQLGELGRTDVQVAAEGPELERALEEAFVLHARRWQGRPDVSTFGNPRGRAFNREALTALAAGGHVRLLTVRVDQRAVAFACSLLVARRMYLYRLAFDPAYGQFSPGILATLEAIRLGSGEGVETVELLRGTERYKLEMADRIDPLYEAVVTAGGLRAGVARTVLMQRMRLKRTIGAGRRRVRALAEDLERRKKTR